MPLKKVFFLCATLFSLAVTGQTTKLCGIWLGYGYQGENIVGNSVYFYNVPYEIISITQQGSYTVATKILGDDCVTSGHVTWEGNDTDTTFNILVTAGAPNNPNAVQGPSNITYIDSNHITLGAGQVNYVKASCKQIDSMSYQFTTTDIGCTTCGVLAMPNVFTPNNDGMNDFFLPTVAKNLSNYKLVIYSRWGNEVFSTNDYTQGWNGKANSQDCPSGVYYWVCTYNSNSDKGQISKNGFLQLLR